MVHALSTCTTTNRTSCRRRRRAMRRETRCDEPNRLTTGPTAALATPHHPEGETVPAEVQGARAASGH
eukprot:6407131-Prymnesium_polylepis.1